ncbi:MAG: ABC transporter substrate-binding protein [Chloroflexi bacterium]|nr:ABC transporter substrate-binding protein [Chloroflexota bacterium]
MLGKRRLLTIMGVLLLVVAACGPAATATPVPTAAPGKPTPTAAPTVAPTAAPTAAKGPVRGGSLVVMKRGDPQSWDPDYTPGGARDTRETYQAVFSLMATSIPLKEPCQATINPEVAESWRWINDTTFEIKVRQGIKFQNKPPVNGRELTSEDVAYSLMRSMEAPRRGLGSLPEHVKSAKALDATTVQVTTDGPAPILDLYMASFYGSPVLPKEAADAKGRFEAPETYIGSGPFTFDQYVPGVKLVFGRNPTYWKQGLPYVDQMTQLIMGDQSTRMATLRAGKLDLWFGELPVTAAKELQATARNLQVQKCSQFSGPGKLWMRTDKADSPFADIRVRRAISMAIDREALVKTVLQGEASPVAIYPAGISPLVQAADQFPPEIRNYLTHNPSEAKKLLAEAGFPSGFTTSLTATPYYRSPYVEIVEALIAMLGEVGIKVQPNWVEYGAWSSTALRGTYADLLYGLTVSGEPLDDLGRFHSKAGFNLNRSHLNDPTLDSLIDEMLIAKDESQRQALAFKIQDRVVDQAYAFVTPIPFDFAFFQPWVKGFLWSGSFYWSGPYLERVWLEK